MVTNQGSSERFVVDSSGWVEYLAGGEKADAFATFLTNTESVLLPSVVVYEVYKKLLRERGSSTAAQFLSQAYGFQEREIPLDTGLAALAAQVSVEKHLAMADAIVYATAQAHRAQLVTSDTRFSGLPGVTVL